VNYGLVYSSVADDREDAIGKELRCYLILLLS